MTDPNSADHWNLLASEIGAEPSAAEPLPAKPATPPRQPARSEVAPQPKPAGEATDWSNLASSLGIEVPPEDRIAPPSG